MYLEQLVEMVYLYLYYILEDQAWNPDLHILSSPPLLPSLSSNLSPPSFPLPLPPASLPAALGDECSPLPMQPVVVGYDHEWLAVSPLALPAWVSVRVGGYVGMGV